MRRTQPRAARRASTGLRLLAIAVAVVSVADPAIGQDPGAETIAALRAQADHEGWTFSVEQNPVSGLPLEQLCGMVAPEDWWVGAPADDDPPRLGLPEAFDWRDSGGCPAVRNQGACGSCWAFSTVGALECNILIRDGLEVDLSEQWLVSCNQSGYGCDGGWWAHGYHQDLTDTCGGTGAVLEADFPYVAAEVPCDCPYDHVYTIDGWGYVSAEITPSVAQIKQAILDYGPVSITVCVDVAFQCYSEGVFNACAGGDINHAVVLVGWDDNQGTEGVWILRNSWGPAWGEDGYMRIEYGCSSVGDYACYVQYPGADPSVIDVTPESLAFGELTVGEVSTQSFTVTNTGAGVLAGSASGLTAPFSFVGDTVYSLGTGETQTITVQFAPTLLGTFDDTVMFSGGGGAQRSVTGSGIGSGASNNCADAPDIADGTFNANNSDATTDWPSLCGGGATADVWWRYVAPSTGLATIDTCGSDFDTVLSVYDECYGEELACNGDYVDCGSASRVTLDVLADEDYYIRVAGWEWETGNITLNVETTTPAHTISGHVATATGDPVADVTITGLPGEPLTNASGDYTVTVDYGFGGTAVPQKTDYTFEPASRDYNNVITDVSDQDFEADPPTVTISGQVADDSGILLAGVVITGLPGAPVTSDTGQYVATVPVGFSGTATPSKVNYTFTPTTRTYSDVASNLAGQDYNWAIQTGSLYVILKPADSHAAGALWRIDEGDWHESGETVTNITVGLHTVSYAVVDDWSSPDDEQVLIQNAQTMTLERAYIDQRPSPEPVDNDLPTDDDSGDGDDDSGVDDVANDDDITADPVEAEELEPDPNQADPIDLPPVVTPACGFGLVELLAFPLCALAACRRSRKPTRPG